MEKYEELISQISQMIKGMNITEQARENISENFWEYLGISPQKKYKIAEVEVFKTIYKKINIAVPIDANEKEIENAADDLDLDYIDTSHPDDEDDWVVNQITEVKPYAYTADQIKDKYDDDDDLYNLADFEYRNY